MEKEGKGWGMTGEGGVEGWGAKRKGRDERGGKGGERKGWGTPERGKGLGRERKGKEGTSKGWFTPSCSKS